MLKIPKFVNDLYYENDIIEIFRGSLIHVKIIFYISTTPCPVSVHAYILMSTGDNV